MDFYNYAAFFIISRYYEIKAKNLFSSLTLTNFYSCHRQHTFFYFLIKYLFKKFCILIPVPV